MCPQDQEELLHREPQKITEHRELQVAQPVTLAPLETWGLSSQRREQEEAHEEKSRSAILSEQSAMKRAFAEVNTLLPEQTAAGSPIQEEAPAKESYKERRRRDQRYEEAKKKTNFADRFTMDLFEGVKVRNANKEARLEAAGIQLQDRERQSGNSGAVSAVLLSLASAKTLEGVSDSDKEQQLTRLREQAEDLRSREPERVAKQLLPVMRKLATVNFTPRMLQKDYFVAHFEESMDLADQISAVTGYLNAVSVSGVTKSDGSPISVEEVLHEQYPFDMALFTARKEQYATYVQNANWLFVSSGIVKDEGAFLDMKMPGHRELKMKVETMRNSSIPLLEDIYRPGQDATAATVNVILKDCYRVQSDLTVQEAYVNPAYATAQQQITQNPAAYARQKGALDPVYTAMFRSNDVLVRTRHDLTIYANIRIPELTEEQKKLVEEEKTRRMVKFVENQAVHERMLESCGHLVSYCLGKASYLSEEQRAVFAEVAPEAYQIDEQQRETALRTFRAEVGETRGSYEGLVVGRAVAAYTERRNNSTKRFEEYLASQGEKVTVDPRIFSSFAKGYTMKEDGSPATEEDAAKLADDLAFMKDYNSGDIERRKPHLTRMLTNLLAIQVTPAQFSPAYVAEHAEALAAQAQMFTYIENVFKEPMNAAYLEEAYPQEMALIRQRQAEQQSFTGAMHHYVGAMGINLNDGSRYTDARFHEANDSIATFTYQAFVTMYQSNRSKDEGGSP